MKPEKFRYSFQFWRVCFSSYLFFMSFNMIIPELPSYLTDLGGEDYKGLIIGLFTITAFIARPFSGRLADTVGRLPIIGIGTLVCVLMGTLYPFVVGVSGFLILRFFHGFSTGFQPTGTTAYLADIIPFNRRGEAMGYLGVAGLLGMASGQPIGGSIANNLSIDHLFFTSAGIALLSLIMLAGIKETLPQTTRFKWSHLAVWKEPMYDKQAFPATIVMVLTAYSFGLVLTVIPDFSEHIGILNKGLFFMVFTFSSIFSRLIAGKASDYYGRVPVLIVATVIQSGSMVIMAFTTGTVSFFAGALVFGIGGGMISPTLFAWTVDLGNEKARAISIATVYMGMEFGIFLGAVLSALLFNNKAANFPITYLSAALLSFIALVYLIRYTVRINRSS